VAVGILEIHPASAAPIVDLHIFLRRGTAPIRNAGFFDAAEDRVELRVAHVEGVVMHFEVIPVI